MKFTQQALDFASGKPTYLLKGDALIELVREVQAVSTGYRKVIHEVKAKCLCFMCGKELVESVAKRGVNKGKSFFGMLSISEM